MAKYRIERSQAPIWLRTLIPVIAIPITFLITSVLVLAANANPLEAYYNFLIVPLSTRSSAIEVLVKATPILLTGAAVAFAFTPATGTLVRKASCTPGPLPVHSSASPSKTSPRGSAFRL